MTLILGSRLLDEHAALERARIDDAVGGGVDLERACAARGTGRFRGGMSRRGGGALSADANLVALAKRKGGEFIDPPGNTVVGASTTVTGRVLQQTLSQIAATAPAWDGTKFTTNGTTQKLTGTWAFLNGATKVTMLLAMKGPSSRAATQVMVELGTASDRVDFYQDTTFATALAVKGGALFNGRGNSGVSADGRGVWCIRADYTAGLGATKDILFNGKTVAALQTTAGSDVTGGALGSGSISIGAQAGGTAFSAVEFYGGLFLPDALTDAEAIQASQWLRAKYPQMSDTVVVASDYLDTLAPFANGGLLRVSSFARTLFQTDAETLDVDVFCTIGSPYNTIAWRQNGGARNVVSVGTGGTFTLSPGSGGVSKSIEIELGPQSYRGVPNTGTYLGGSVRVPSGRSISVTGASAPSRRAVLIVDSLGEGQAAATPQSQGFAALVRESYPGRTTVLGAGVYSLFSLSTVQFASINALAAAIVGLCDGTSRNDVILEVTTNDFILAGASQWASAATYRAAKASLLTAIKTQALAASKTVNVYVITLMPRTDVVNNDHAESQPTWRGADAGSVSDAGFGIVLDGTTIGPASPGGGDGLHFTTPQQQSFHDNTRSQVGW